MLFHIPRGTFVIFWIFPSVIEINIERREFYNTDSVQFFFVFILLSNFVIKDFSSCLSILEHNFVSYNEIF